MLTSGDVRGLDLGVPEGREAGFGRPAVVVTADRILRAGPAVVQVVPITSTVRDFRSEVRLDPDVDNGLDRASVAQCQHVRSVSSGRLGEVRGNVGAVALAQIREALGLIFDLGG